jgi:hypothetical protein
MGIYASAIWAKLQDINESAETLFFHIRWILAHGEIVLLYAEDLSVCILRRNQFCPGDHRKLDDILRNRLLRMVQSESQKIASPTSSFTRPETLIH